MSQAVQRLTTLEIDLGAARSHVAANFAAVAGFAWPETTGSLDALAAALLARVAPHDRARVEREWRALLQDPAARSGTTAFDVADADAMTRRLECAWSLGRGPGGEPLRLFVACVHAEPPSAAEARWRESDQRYRTALNAGRLGSWETDYVAQTRTWSPEGLALFGLDLPEGRGRVGGPDDEYRNALHPADRHLADDYRALAERQDDFDAEYRIVRPDGRTLWLAGRGLVMARSADGKVRRLVSIMADVTERRRAEETLRTERERLALALDAGRMGAFEYDIAADVLWWSPATYALFGVTPETFTPTPPNLLALVHPDDRDGFVRGRAQALAERRSFAHEFRIVRPDGKLAWIEHFGRGEYAADGRALRTYGISMDVTERRLQEEAVRHADQQKDRFIATLAHELRNPLAPIRNAVELLRRSTHADPALAWQRDVIDRQVQQMSRLLDDLLDVARITQGKIRLRRTTFALGTALEQAIEAAAPLIASLGHRLDVSMPPEPLLVEADPTRLAQVFSNLLVNAAKYTPPHGHVGVTVRREAGAAVVTVKDDGQGIAPAQLAQLFQMFGQGEDALERSQTGLGIGLWLTRALVGLHGGSIAAQSEGPGRGSAFVVRLPLARGRAPAERPGVPAVSAPAAPSAAPAHVDGVSPPVPTGRAAAPDEPAHLRVLIADDKADLADSLAALLRLDGHEVRVAYSGESALAAARTFQPHAAVLDLGMPGLDGYELCRALRAEPGGSALTLIAQTGWGLAEHRQRSREAGFDHHVVKPVDPRELIELLQQRRAQRPGQAPASAGTGSAE